VRPDYQDPDRLEDALALLARHGDEAKIVAGGQSLMVMLRQGLLSPSVLVDLVRIRGLAGIDRIDGEVRIGAMTTIRTLEKDARITALFPALAEAAAAVGPLQVRNMGTLGGNTAHNALGADPPPALLALDTRATVQSATGQRTLPVEALLTGYFETALAPDELIVEFTFPVLPTGTRGRYLKFATRAVDMALVGIAAVLRRADGGVVDVRIAIGGAAPAPFRAHTAETFLRGEQWSDGALREAGRLAALDADPLSDVHGSADYRRWLVRHLVPRALAVAANGDTEERPA
jgi:carbon-monoxide dehydrogenase medium subunit